MVASLKAERFIIERMTIRTLIVCKIRSDSFDENLMSKTVLDQVRIVAVNASRRSPHLPADGLAGDDGNPAVPQRYHRRFATGDAGARVRQLRQLAGARTADPDDADRSFVAEMLGSSLSQSGFNIGNAAGAFLGGIDLALGYSYVAPQWVRAGMALRGIALALLMLGHSARSRVVAATA